MKVKKKNMFEIHKQSIQFGRETLTIETGRIARQADGAVLVTYGETVVLVTVVAEKKARPGLDFFPLTIQYQEKFYAAGKIPGGFIKRETRPSEQEILTSRMIDRPVRPLFKKGFANETQVIATVISYDNVNSPDVAAMAGVSAALMLSGLPFQGPIGGARVGYLDGVYVLNPSMEQLEKSRLDLFVAGTSDAVTMVESEADFLSEGEMLEAVMFGFESFQPVVQMIQKMASVCGKPAWKMPEESEPVMDTALQEVLKKSCEKDLKNAYGIQEKQARYAAVDAVKTGALEAYGEGDESRSGAIQSILKSMESTIVREAILATGQRIDGRSLTEVRSIDCQVSVLPRTHGSSLFTRGETQALVSLTLGTGRDEQIVENMSGEWRDSFYLQYIFPPYSVGEVGRTGAPGRREIGHGKLATRALQAIVPDKEQFPYTMRVVSEITESNGSSSMATVCGSVLALMDAGVPVKAPVAGIAMGLIKEGERFAVLSDILGDEDHLGDMDFKVAGAEEGITALQMDIKITGITREIMAIALNQAREGCLHILGEMRNGLTTHREELSEHAPRILTLKIHPDKIRDVIGPGGKVIRSITEETGCDINVEDDGTVQIASSNQQAGDTALKMVKRIVADVEVGQIYDGKVMRITDFGAFVNILPNKDGLVHISQLAKHRVQKVTDIVKEGDSARVKVLDIDRQGRVRLTMKDVE